MKRSLNYNDAIIYESFSNINDDELSILIDGRTNKLIIVCNDSTMCDIIAFDVPYSNNEYIYELLKFNNGI